MEAEKPTAWAGLMGPLLGCSWRRAPAGGQDLGHLPPSAPRAPARLSPHPSGSWRGLPRCSPRRSPRALPGSWARAARSPAPPTQGDPYLWEQRRAAVAGWTITVCRDASGLGRGSGPQRDKQPKPPQAQHALPP